MNEADNETPKYIRVISCSSPHYWYVDKIGKVYKVKNKNQAEGNYEISSKSGMAWIGIEDCTPVSLEAGSKAKAKRYKGQYLYGIGEDLYRKLYEGKEFTIEKAEVNIITGNTFYTLQEDPQYFRLHLHHSLLKPI